MTTPAPAVLARAATAADAAITADIATTRSRMADLIRKHIPVATIMELLK